MIATKNIPETYDDIKVVVQSETNIAISEEQPEADVSIDDTGGAKPYSGSYEVTPKVTEQSLATARKYMSKDILVHEIPIYETSNVSGGMTVYIGSEVN